MPKIVIIGAGSLVFTRTLVKDIVAVPALADSTFSLVDTDEERLEFAKQAVGRIIKEAKCKAKVEVSLDRRDALKGADYVIMTILIGGVEAFRPEILIPIKYGVDINIGDTLGPSGVFRALRTIPAMLEIAHDMERYCPDAFMLNYTNPMSMLCRAIERGSSIRAVGLCHSVQGTSEMLARWIGAPIGEIDFLCAGINHQAWFLEFKWKGKDAIPDLLKAIEKPEIYQQELVRNEMFKHLGYYVTESSGHNSEYNAWFRKRKDLYEKYCVHGTNWNPGVSRYSLDERERRENSWRDEVKKQLHDPTPLNLTRSHEYCSYILEAIETNTPLKINGNVRNRDLITNLPPNCCVEVPVYIDRRGFQPIHVGALPPQLMALNQQNIAVQEMAVEAHFTRNRDLVYQACYFDPLSAAVLSLEEIRKMVDELFEVQGERLPQFR
ncbi:MAG: alpha-galactosidase [Candidatus Tectomicrobia bacterium]|nr:alpha-galactosidase [Candidatus Tectomicrobia bacterium]